MHDCFMVMKLKKQTNNNHNPVVEADNKIVVYNINYQATEVRTWNKFRMRAQVIKNVQFILL